ncbi:TIGR02391 family protein [Actinomadura geliboluensis]
MMPVRSSKPLQAGAEDVFKAVAHRGQARNNGNHRFAINKATSANQDTRSDMPRQDYTATALIPHGHHQNWQLFEEVLTEVARVTDQWDEKEITFRVEGPRNLYGSYSSVLDAHIELGDDKRDVSQSEITCSTEGEDDERYVSITFAKNSKSTSWVYVSGPIKKQCEDLSRGLQAFILEKIRFPHAAGQQNSHDDLEARLQHLHPIIKNHSLTRLRNGHGDEAVEEACKSIGARLRSLSGVDDDGASLVGTALGGKPIVAVNDLTSKSDLSEQDGYMHLGMGIFRAARNPRAHRPSDPNFSIDEVIEWLSVASALHRALDRARKI